MITIAVCDSNEIDRKNTIDLCKRCMQSLDELYSIKEYASGEEFLQEDETDLLLLDVKMKQVDGILLKDLLRIMRSKTRIIFISRETSYMEAAFGYNVYGFLVKPIEYQKLQKMISLAVEDILEYRKYIYCKVVIDYEKTYQKIFLKDILYVEADGHKTRVYVEMGKKCVMSDKRIGEWRRDYVKNGFLCCHRCYMVNPLYIAHVDREIELMSGQRLPISDERRKEFLGCFERYKKLRNEMTKKEKI